MLERVEQLYEQGEYTEAIALAEEALEIREQALGPEHPDVAESLNHLASAQVAQGHYVVAERLHRRALSIRESALGPEHPDVAESLNELAILHQFQGNYEVAESLHERALAIREQVLGSGHPDVGTSLNNLAELHAVQGHYQVAEPLHRRALAIAEEALGPEHPDTATSLNNVAILHYYQGNYEEAEALHRRALAIREKVLGPRHPHIAQSLNNLAELYAIQGNYEDAEPLHRRALAIWEETLGPRHPHAAVTRQNLATLYWARGDIARAIVHAARAEQVNEDHLEAMLETKSEHARCAFLARLASKLDRWLSLILATGAPDAQRLGARLLLRRKGRVLDSLAGRFAALRSHLEVPEQKILDKYQSLTTEYATRSLRGPGRTTIEQHREHLDELARRRRALERKLAAHSRTLRGQRAPVTVAAVQDALPPDTALIEWARYRPFDPRARLEADKYGPARYAACLLRARAAPACVDLGEAATIEAEIDAWRHAIVTRGADASRLGRAVEARIMAPVRAHLDGAEHLFLAPDGDLSLIPMGALVDDHGRYLIEGYRITYVTSGRELLRPEAAPARQGALVIADPSFGPRSPQPPAPRSEDLLGVHVKPLPGTAQEAEALRARLAHVEAWTGDQATEARLKTEVHGPALLHIATHGVWLRDVEPAPVLTNRRALVLARTKPLSLVPDPMVRSGLAVAGFNQREHGADDGFLTALEAASLDLHGTQLVVLSACDTGLGEVKSGQGVYGLRRALVLAGARTVVMSLWQVDDTATRDLMIAYYDRLLAGEGRSEAMRQAQLALLRADATAHPYYWAGFIVSGDPGPMTGLVPRPRPTGSDSILARRTELGMPAAVVLCVLLAAALLVLRRRRRSAAESWTDFTFLLSGTRK